MIDMTKQVPIDLEKKATMVTAMMRERGMREAPTLRVALALDNSGSMRQHIYNGNVQKAVDQIGGVAIRFDDNGEIDTWTFNHSYKPVGTWTPKDYGTYVDKKGISAHGGTAYEPVIRAITAQMFEPQRSSFFGVKKTDTTPVLAIMLTDGENSDHRAIVEKAIVDSSRNPIYWMLVGVGNERFATIRHLGDKFDNVGFVPLADFGLDDRNVYNALINEELIEFLKRFK